MKLFLDTPNILAFIILSCSCCRTAHFVEDFSLYFSVVFMLMFSVIEQVDLLNQVYYHALNAFNVLPVRYKN